MITNKKHKAFADEYLANGMNGTQAYLSIYKSVKKEDTAAVNASKLLRNTKVKAYIKAEQDKTSAKLNIDKEYILREYMALISSCKEEGIDGEGTLKDRTNWAKGLAQLTKMLGLDEPDKTEITHKGLTINYVKPKDKEKDE